MASKWTALHNNTTLGVVVPGYYLIVPSAGNAAVNLANGLNQRLVLTGTAVTILAPTYSGGTIAPGTSFSLYLDQDATGNRAVELETADLAALIEHYTDQNVALTVAFASPARWADARNFQRLLADQGVLDRPIGSDDDCGLVKKADYAFG